MPIMFEASYKNSTDLNIVAIGNPERHVRRASHRGSKQQYRSPDEITLVVTVRKHIQLFTRFTSIVRGHSPRSLQRDHSIIAGSRHIYVWCCSSRASRSWWIKQSTQHHRRGCNTCKASRISQLHPLPGSATPCSLGINPTSAACTSDSTLSVITQDLWPSSRWESEQRPI